MKQQCRFNTRPFIPCGFVLLALPCLLAAGARDAAQNVHEGLEHFGQGQFKQAADAFEKAGQALPNDARIDFNRACVAAADGNAADGDLAVELFQKAAASTDPKLAAAGRYCLGCLAAVKAKAAFGEKPGDAAPEVRKEGLEHLGRAVEHYRDSLKLDPQHEDARYNLETIRHWVKQMKDLWRQRDRQKKRDGLNLPDYVLMLEKEQQEIRGLSKTLGKQPDTPLWREQLDEVRAAQQELAREIEPLKGKIVAALSRQQGGPGTTPAADMQRAVALLSGLADRAGTEMTTAADQLQSARTADALTAQAAAVEMLDQIYMAVVPYPGLVKRSVDTQRELANHTAGVVGPPKASDKSDIDKSQETADNSANGEEPAEEKPEFDPREEAWRQRFVTRWSEVMVAKAKQGLKQMPPQPDKPKADEPKQDTKGPTATDKPADGKPDPAEAAKKKMEALRKSMELAVKLGPKVETLTDEAATHLDEKRPVPALPKQKEALRLLEEIAKPLQDQNQQNQQQQQDQKQQKQDKKDDKKKSDKDKKDKKKDDQKKGGKDKDKEDEKKPPKKKQADKDKDEQDKQKQKAQQPKEMKGQKDKTKDQKKAEAALRRARQRQQERRELEKAVEAQLRRSGTVEKDW